MARVVRVFGALLGLIVAFHAIRLRPPELKTTHQLSSGANSELRRQRRRHSDDAADHAALQQPRSPPLPSFQKDGKTLARTEGYSHTQPEDVRNPSGIDPSPVLVADNPATTTGLLTSASSTKPTDPRRPAEAHEERALAFKQKAFASGFRNAGMAFTWFVMYASENNYTSLLLNNLNWKDLYGKSRPWGFAPHDVLFDVDHWNSHYPLLPRILPYDPTLHDQYDPVTMGPKNGVAETELTRPTFAGTYMQGFNQYRMYTKRVTNNPTRNPRSPVEIAMMKGAFCPSKGLQSFMDRLTGGDPYLALHARVEPDMQNHPVCRDKKVLLLSDIVSKLESHFPHPDFGRVFVATNRPMLEYEADNNLNNTIAAANLKELNRIRDRGMWNGTVRVFEAGSSLMRQSGGDFEKYSGISGAVIDYFLALQASMFVGTEVSSFTADLIQSRFFRDNRRNYHYRPEGILVATKDSDVQPPRFGC